MHQWYSKFSNFVDSLTHLSKTTVHRGHRHVYQLNDIYCCANVLSHCSFSLENL